MRRFFKNYYKFLIWWDLRVTVFNSRKSLFLSKFIRRPFKFIMPLCLVSIGDPKIGKRLVCGEYIFGNVLLDVNTDNPWLIDIPSFDVAEALHGFKWLNDLSAFGTMEARHLSMLWLTKWFEIYSDENGFFSSSRITALRLTNVCRNVEFLSKSLTEDKHFDILISLNKSFFYLSLMKDKVTNPIEKVQIIFALLVLNVISAKRTKTVSLFHSFIKQMDKALNKQGFVSNRNPEDLLKLFLILMEATGLFDNLEYENKKLRDALSRLQEKIVPVLRGLRMGNGALTRNHGGDFGLLSVFDETLARSGIKIPPVYENVMGFERISAGRLVLLVDCAPPPKSFHSKKAHASCLSFELSSGQRPIFVNCGPGSRFGIEYERFCRSTRAHNTCTLAEMSQSEYQVVSRNNFLREEIIVRGPEAVSVKREKTLDATILDLSHDGYLYDYGFFHIRKLLMLNSGKAFSGTDIFKLDKMRKVNSHRNLNFSAYFHLHPDVEVWDHPQLQTIILRLKNGEHWIFESDLGKVLLEESTFIDTSNGNPVSTRAIVVFSPTLYENVEIKWSLRRREIVSRNTRDVDISQ